jgi:hypothetical protein
VYRHNNNILLCTIISDNATFQLKGLYIPPDGIVIVDDIGGNLGYHDGLFCEVKNRTNNLMSLSDVYWAFPNNSQIIHPPPKDSNQYGSESCKNNDNCTSLYYDGEPLERGQFRCVVEWTLLIVDQSFLQPIEYERVPVNIVNLTIHSITGPNDHVLAGDTITISVSVSVEPADTPIPYQWQLNGNDLSDSNTHKGVNTATLTITNIQDQDKGKYRVSVAHSESRFTGNVTITVGKCDVMNMAR